MNKVLQPEGWVKPVGYSNGVAAKALVKGYSTALRIYDLSGGWRIGHRYQRITRDETLSHLPTLNASRLVAGFLYYDARGDDARVALTLAKTAALDFHATVANYVRAVDVGHDESGRVNEVRCRDELTGDEFAVRTKSVINASGVWADDIFTMTEHQPSHRISSVVP